MIFGMTYMEFIGLVAAIIALVITIYRAQITPTAEAVKLLLEPLNTSLAECAEEIESKEKKITKLQKDHRKWKVYVIAFTKKMVTEVEELRKKLEEVE